MINISHLQHLDQLELQQRELNADIKRHQAERESLGVNLYELQQELGRQQANLEDEHDKMANEHQVPICSARLLAFDTFI